MFGQPRTTLLKVILLASLVSFITLLYLSSASSFRSFLPDSLFPARVRASCSPEAWSNGSWTYLPSNISHPLEKEEQVWEYNGLGGCAADREFWWHLGVDHDTEFSRFGHDTTLVQSDNEDGSQDEEWVKGIADWVWTPSEECKGVRELESSAFVRDLVEQGGWLVLGDSITENHFFSLSCSLWPHVLATPNYTENPYFDRAWPQNLYLNPNSPLIPSLDIPLGFSTESTPLVTFRRIDLLLTKEELENIHRGMHPELYEHRRPTSPIDLDLDSDPFDEEYPGGLDTDGNTITQAPEFQLFSEEAVWSMSPAEYMSIFTSPLPTARYATLIVSTAGHWTTTLFHGLRDESKSEWTYGQPNSGWGIEGVLELFEEAMKVWAGDVQRYLVDDQKRQMKESIKGIIGSKGKTKPRMVNRQVVVRAYLPGHENCRNIRLPWTEWVDYTVNWYNWPWIPVMNTIFQRVLSARDSYPDIHFLPIDRPALLRPDAHVSGDCLHLITGVGVIEGWTRYIWHFVTRELPGRIR